jgi:muconate cycloisomerase
MTTHIHCLRVHQISLPMRVGFKHAAAERKRTENLVVELELGSGVLGFGESAPRPYVSGETLASAAAAVRSEFLEPLLAIRPDRFSDLLTAADALPFTDAAGRPITSARAAVELALLDAYSRSFGRSLEEIAGWLGSSRFGTPGSMHSVRYSGVISAGEPKKVLRRLWIQRHLLGLGDFKFKVGRPDDRQVLDAVARKLGRRITAGTASIRVDANCAWSPDEAAAWIGRMTDLPIASLEQPVPRDQDGQLPNIRKAGTIPLMVDESLVTPADADRLIASGGVDLFNIRVSKNGGLIAAMRLAERAAAAGLGFQLGCMVGETGLLSAAGQWFLSMVRGVQFAEGSFGRLLLADDITRPSPRFGWRGKVRPMSGLGLGVTVDRGKLAKYAVAEPIEIHL